MTKRIPLLVEKLESVVDEHTFLAFAQELLAERRWVSSLPLELDGFQGDWANNSIDSFLDAAVSWAEDSGFGIRPGPRPENSWQLFASFLWAGRSYE